MRANTDELRLFWNARYHSPEIVSRFSISCRQVGPISVDLSKLPPDEKVYSKSTSLFFKHTQVFRTVDAKRKTLIYLAISDRLIEGSPQNAIATVPLMPWPTH